MPPLNIIDVGVSSVLGSRTYQEDRYCVLNAGDIKSRKDVALFAVFDGHGGTQTVDHVAAHFTAHLELHFAATSRPLEPDEYRQMLQRAIRAVDRDLMKADLQGGSTVALALVDTKQW